MEMTVKSTDKLVEIDGVPARIWEGVSARGVRVHCYITRVAVKHGDDVGEFQSELQEHAPPTPLVAALPSRITLKGGV